jgi:prepilin-type N-terminal cleavage/methylation domain-containing protein
MRTIVRQSAATRVPDSSPIRRGGFTLIEVLAVVLIIAILAAFLVTRLGGAEEAVKASNTRGFIAQLSAAIEVYEGRAMPCWPG